MRGYPPLLHIHFDTLTPQLVVNSDDRISRRSSCNASANINTAPYGSCSKGTGGIPLVVNVSLEHADRETSSTNKRSNTLSELSACDIAGAERLHHFGSA